MTGPATRRAARTTDAPPYPERPRRRPWHAVTGLDDFAIVTWAVDPDRLAGLLPPGFEPRTTAHDGSEVALVSAVAFTDRDFRFRGAPFVRMSCGQVNYRAYVRHRGEDGVWFFGTSLGHPLVVVARLLWAMPWHRERVEVQGDWSAGARRIVARTTGAWGALELDLADGAAGEGGTASGPWDEPWVTDPLVGWFGRTRGGLGRYSVWHPALGLEPIGVRSARSAVFERLGLVAPGTPPVAARVVPTATFDVHTPPLRLGEPFG